MLLVPIAGSKIFAGNDKTIITLFQGIVNTSLG
jgi:hypothetical protein